MNDQVALWGGKVFFGRAPADGEILIGNGVDFTLAPITAGSNVTIANTAGGIEISSTNSGGTITAVTATSPLKSSGGTAPDISIDGAVDVAHGGTGAATLTLNNVILGNGTSSVQFVAPGAAGNVLMSDGTTWGSASSGAIYKTSDQSIASTITFTDISQLSFPVVAGQLYFFQASLLAVNGAGGLQVAVNGPTLTSLNVGAVTLALVTAYDTSIRTSSGAASIPIQFFGAIQCSANGSVALRFRQDTTNVANTTILAGSQLWYSKAQ